MSPLVEPTEQKPSAKPVMFSAISKVAMEMRSASKKSVDKKSDKKSDKSPLDKSVKEKPAFKYPGNLRMKLKESINQSLRSSQDSSPRRPMRIKTGKSSFKTKA